MPQRSASSPEILINPLIRAESAKMVQDREAKASEAQEQQANSQLSNMASYVLAWYDANKRYRDTEGIDTLMRENLTQRNSEYTLDKKSKIEQAGEPLVYLGLTGVKCRAAEAWIHDIWSSDAPKAFGLKPTTLPDLSPTEQAVIVERVMQKFKAQLEQTGQPAEAADVELLAMQYREEMERLNVLKAEEAANRMECVIDDDLQEANWTKVFSQVLTDLTTMPVAVMKGPVIRRARKMQWVQNEKGKTVAKVKMTTSKHLYRVSPFDIFPSDGATTVNEGILIERMGIPRRELADMKGLPHYYDSAIDAVLLQNATPSPTTSNPSSDSERAEQELRGFDKKLGSDKVEVLDFWGSCSGKDLIDNGIMVDPKGKAIDPIREYEMNIMLADSKFIIYAWFNEDPLLRRPYHKTGWAERPGSFWYMSIPEIMSPLQSMCNGAARALAKNLALCSGPQVIISDFNRLPPGEKATAMYPNKVWVCVNPTKSQVKPIDFFQIKSNVGELMAVYDEFAKMADDWTGIPAYSYGNERVAGAGRTASGLSMLMSSAARGIKKVIFRFDTDIVNPMLQMMYDWEMMYNEDESIKGDVQIVPKGIMAILLKEQLAAQRMEFLKTTAQMPIAQQVMGVEGVANVLRETASILQMNDGEVVPDKNKVRMIVEQQAAMALQQQQLMAQQQAQEQTEQLPEPTIAGGMAQ